MGRSKGYGFIEFTRHSDALVCLRWLNNNPTAFKVVSDDEGETATENPSPTNRQRPIVEFAIENKMVVKRRAERQKNGKFPSDKPGSKADSEKDSEKTKGSKRKREGDDAGPTKMKNARSAKEKGSQDKTVDAKKPGHKASDRVATKAPGQNSSKSLQNSEPKKSNSFGAIKSDKVTKTPTPQASAVNKKVVKSIPKRKAPTKIDLQLPAADVNKWIS